MKEKVIDVKVSCPELSGAIQRIALNIGYKWYSGKEIVSQTDKAILCFNKDDEDITFGGSHNCPIYTLPQDWDKVVEFLKQKESSIERIDKLFSEYHNRHKLPPRFMLIGADVENVIIQETTMFPPNHPFVSARFIDTYLDCKVIRSNDLEAGEIIFTS